MATGFAHFLIIYMHHARASRNSVILALLFIVTSVVVDVCRVPSCSCLFVILFFRFCDLRVLSLSQLSVNSVHIRVIFCLGSFCIISSSCVLSQGFGRRHCHRKFAYFSASIRFVRSSSAFECFHHHSGRLILSLSGSSRHLFQKSRVTFCPSDYSSRPYSRVSGLFQTFRLLVLNHFLRVYSGPFGFFFLFQDSRSIPDLSISLSYSRILCLSQTSFSNFVSFRVPSGHSAS